VATNGTPVDEAEWRSLSADGRWPIRLYELKVAD